MDNLGKNNKTTIKSVSINEEKNDGKKTYKSKINKKGVATFKIKKLTKKKANTQQQYKGNRKYKAITKKVKITIK